jgi:putative sterol carrier protein
MATSVKAFFDERVPAVLKTSPEKAKDVVSNPPTCIPGEHGAPQCTVEASDADFRSMIEGGMQAAMSLFFSGKLKVGGDPVLATKLSKLLQMAG